MQLFLHDILSGSVVLATPSCTGCQDKGEIQLSECNIAINSKTDIISTEDLYLFFFFPLLLYYVLLLF